MSFWAINCESMRSCSDKSRCPLFSQTAEYALRAVAHLANSPDRMSTIPEMAEAIQVNAPYLRKVLDKLREQEIVSTQRGSGGGTYLSVAPGELTMLDVINAVDPPRRIRSCPLGLPDHMDLCPLHAELDDAMSKVEEILSSRTIGELLRTRSSSERCGFPESEDIYQL